MGEMNAYDKSSVAKKERVLILASLDSRDLEKIKEIARENDVSVSSVIRMMVKEYLRRYGVGRGEEETEDLSKA